jgi:hypothetical protein
MDTTYLNRKRITLEPVWHTDAPQVRVGIDDHLQTATLRQTTVFDLDFDATAGPAELIVEFFNKKDSDTDVENQLDKAVIVEKIEIFGICDPKFIYTSNYTPTYPEPWASQQTALGLPLQPVLRGHNYLGWNGRWCLPFTVPIFTWVHKTQDLGWIYT